MLEIVAGFTHLARQSPHISQHSGVSVRMSITNTETLRANAVRRALGAGERVAAPRVSDLESLAASTMGKLEVETFQDGRSGAIVDQLLLAAVLATFREVVDPSRLAAVVAEVAELGQVDVGADMTLQEFREGLASRPVLAALASEIAGVDGADPSSDSELAVIASAAELVLEGLHLSKRLNKDSIGTRSTYVTR